MASFCNELRNGLDKGKEVLSELVGKWSPAKQDPQEVFQESDVLEDLKLFLSEKGIDFLPPSERFQTLLSENDRGDLYVAFTLFNMLEGTVEEFKREHEHS